MVDRQTGTANRMGGSGWGRGGGGRRRGRGGQEQDEEDEEEPRVRAVQAQHAEHRVAGAGGGWRYGAARLVARCCGGAAAVPSAVGCLRTSPSTRHSYLPHGIRGASREQRARHTHGATQHGAHTDNATADVRQRQQRNRRQNGGKNATRQKLRQTVRRSAMYLPWLEAGARSSYESHHSFGIGCSTTLCAAPEASCQRDAIGNRDSTARVVSTQCYWKSLLHPGFARSALGARRSECAGLHIGVRQHSGSAVGATRRTHRGNRFVQRPNALCGVGTASGVVPHARRLRARVRILTRIAPTQHSVSAYSCSDTCSSRKSRRCRARAHPAGFPAGSSRCGPSPAAENSPARGEHGSFSWCGECSRRR